MNFCNVIFGGFLLFSLTVCRQAGFYFGLALSIKILTTQHAGIELGPDIYYFSENA